MNEAEEDNSSTRPKKVELDEEKDFFLTYINKHLESINKDLNFITRKEKESKVPAEKKNEYLQLKVSLGESKMRFEDMKEHYYRAFTTKKRFNNGKYFFFDSLSGNSASSSQRFKFQDRSDLFSFSGSRDKQLISDVLSSNSGSILASERGEFSLKDKAIIRSLLNLIYVSKFIKNIQRKDEFLSIFSNLNISFNQLDEIPKFYDNIFSFSSQSQSTVEAKLLCSLHMLEILLNEKHPLHIHFSHMKSRVDQISSIDIFLKKVLGGEEAGQVAGPFNKKANQPPQEQGGIKIGQNRFFEDIGGRLQERNNNVDLSDLDNIFEKEKGDSSRGLLFQRFHSEFDGSENFDSSFIKNENSGSDDAKKVIRKKLLRKKQSYENYYDGDSEKSFHQREEVKEEENEDDEVNEKAKSEGESSDALKEEGFERRKKPKGFSEIGKKKKDKKKGKNFRINFVDSGGSASEMQDDYKYKINHKQNLLQGAGGLKDSQHRDFDTDKDRL